MEPGTVTAEQMKMMFFVFWKIKCVFSSSFFSSEELNISPQFRIGFRISLKARIFKNGLWIWQKNILVSNDVKRDKRKSVGEDWCGGKVQRSIKNMCWHHNFDLKAFLLKKIYRTTKLKYKRIKLTVLFAVSMFYEEYIQWVPCCYTLDHWCITMFFELLWLYSQYLVTSALKIEKFSFLVHAPPWYN